jgi:hypothetical protein
MTDDNPTPEERDLYQRLHDLKARRMATRDDAERQDIELAIGRYVGRIVTLRGQRLLQDDD